MLDPYTADPPGVPIEQWRELNHSRRWGVYNLWCDGRAYPEHLARCPRTAAVLKDWPRGDVPGSGPSALFSILDAQTRIPPHHETWNDGDRPRAVMIFDTWSPFLRLAERELVRALTARVGEYYGTFSNQGGI